MLNIRNRGEAMVTPQEVIERSRQAGVQMVDLRFSDLLGVWQHFTIPVEELAPGLFQEGIGFDGSSIRGFQQIHESDMLLLPDAASARVDPMSRVSTLLLYCNVVDPLSRAPYSRDPRGVAGRARRGPPPHRRAPPASAGGPEVEFFVFDDVRYDQNQHSGYYFLDSAEGAWNTGRE